MIEHTHRNFVLWADRGEDPEASTLSLCMVGSHNVIQCILYCRMGVAECPGAPPWRRCRYTPTSGPARAGGAVTPELTNVASEW